MVIFLADISGEPLAAVGGRQDGKKDSVLVKSGYTRKVVVTCCLGKKMRVKPLGEAPSLRPQKRPTDVHRNLSFAFNNRKSEHVALGEEEMVWL